MMNHLFVGMKENVVHGLEKSQNFQLNHIKSLSQVGHTSNL